MALELGKRNKLVSAFLLFWVVWAIPLVIASLWQLISVHSFWQSTTTVTAIVIDANGNPFSNGTASAYIGSGPNSTTVSTDATGAFAMSLASNSYLFTVCASPIDLGPRGNVAPKQICFTSPPIAVSGSTQDISSTLSALAPLLGPALNTTPAAPTSSVSVQPPSIPFGTVQNNTPSDPQNFAITNTGSTPVVMSGCTTDNAKFVVTNPGACIGVLQPGATVVPQVTYRPVTGVLDTSILTVVTSAAPNILNPTTVQLSGQGTTNPTFLLSILSLLGTGSGNVHSDEQPPIINCTILPSAPSTGQCGADYATGATPVLTFTPSGGGSLGTVTGCTVASFQCTPTISSTTTISVTFIAPVPTYQVSLAGIDQGTGTITSDLVDVITGAPLSCTSTAGQITGICTIILNQGAQPVLTEVPLAPNTFVAWGGVTGCTTSSTCQLPPLNSNTNVSADFALPAGSSQAALIQTITGGTAGGSSITIDGNACSNTVTNTNAITTNCTIAAGDAYFVAIREAQDNTFTWTETDSASQTPTQTASGYSNNSSNYRTDIRYVANSASVTSVTANISGTCLSISMVVYKFTGMATSSMLDSSVNSNSTAGGTTWNSGSLTTTNANDLLFFCSAVGAAAGGFTPPGGWTIATNGSANDKLVCDYKIVAATQTNLVTTMTSANGETDATVFAGFKGSGASTTVTGVFSTTAQLLGDANFCSINWNDNTTTVSSITDTSGNTYNQVSASPKAIAGVTVALYEAHNIVAAAASANTVTVTLSASPSVKKLNCAEYSGIITTAPGDGSAGATGTGTAIASGGITTTGTADLIIGVDNVAGTLTATASGFTQRVNGTSNEIEDKNPFAAGTVNFQPTQGTAVNWAAIVAAFKTGGAPQQFIVNITCPGIGGGFVVGSGLNAKCSGGSPSGQFSIPVTSGSILAFTATPLPGSAFSFYNGAGCGNSPSCTTIAIVSNTTIAATFSLSGANAFFVCPSTGSDNNPGTQAAPWATLAKTNTAFVLGASGTVIHGCAGTYAATVLLSRGGPQSNPNIRVTYQCDPGVASAIAAIGQCKIPGSLEVTAGNNIDVIGWDIGNNANAGFAIDVDTDQTTGPGATTTIGNSFHLVGNYLHDVGANVIGNGILGCPQNGMINIANHGGSPTDILVYRNIIIRFGLWATPPAGCNTASLTCCHGNPFIMSDNIIGQAPVGGLLLHDACHFTVSNNVVFTVKSAVYLGNVDGTCSAYGLNTIANNYFFNMAGTSAIFYVSGTSHCDATHPNLFSNNMSDGSKPDTNAQFSCDIITPAALVRQAASLFLVNPVTNAPANTFTGDYHLKAGSAGIQGGLQNNCVTGGTFPCSPSLDFAGNAFTFTGNPLRMDVGPFKF